MAPFTGQGSISLPPCHFARLSVPVLLSRSTVPHMWHLYILIKQPSGEKKKDLLLPTASLITDNNTDICFDSLPVELLQKYRQLCTGREYQFYTATVTDCWHWSLEENLLVRCPVARKLVHSLVYYLCPAAPPGSAKTQEWTMRGSQQCPWGGQDRCALVTRLHLAGYGSPVNMYTHENHPQTCCLSGNRVVWSTRREGKAQETGREQGLKGNGLQDQFRWVTAVRPVTNVFHA